MKQGLKLSPGIRLSLRQTYLILIAVSGLLAAIWLAAQKKSGSSYAQGFESGDRNAEAALCWGFQGWGIQTSDGGTGSRIKGNASLRSPQLTNPANPATLTSPCTQLQGAGELKFSHYNHNFGGGAQRFLQVVLVDMNDLSRDTIYTHTYATTDLVITVLPLTQIGAYQIVWQAWGTGGNSRVWLDEIEVPGEGIAATRASGGDCSCATINLPVVLTHFDARWDHGYPALEWSTAIEWNSSHFEVERSADGEHFVELGRVTAAGNADTPTHYSFTDRQPSPRGTFSFYRLRQVDIDGAFAYSNMVELSPLTGQGNSAFELKKVYPNPVVSTLTFEIDAQAPRRVTMEMIDMNGRTVESGKINAVAGVQEFLLDLSQLPPGRYAYRVMQGAEVRSGLIDRR